MSEFADGFDVDTWRTHLQEKRAEKDEFFADHPQSPIPPDERESFDGLSYFEPDPTYRVQATVHHEPDPQADPVTMETTAGGEMRYLRQVTLSFSLDRASESASGDETEGGGAEGDEADREELELAAYGQEGARTESLFVPFRDKTTGQQTYEGGRYMELEAERTLASGESITLDFNLAYTPFCAFSETFECPLPPEENWLEVAIPAGERLE